MIVDLQVRLRELGKIRIGVTAVSAKSGKKYPEKLSTFRVTSPHRDLIEKVAALYGGQAQEWTPLGGGANQWEVITTATSIPVVVPPTNAYSQWYETWSGGGCTRRCDGERETLSDSPCLCANEEDRVCKPTTRLNVMLREVPALGVFRLESRGYNAAVEIPGVAELCSRMGTEVTASLVLEQRTSKRDGKTEHFMVPGLIPDITPDELVAVGRGRQPAAIAASRAPAAIEAPKPLDFIALAQDATTREELHALWKQAGEADALTDEMKAIMTARAVDLTPPVTEPVDTVEEDVA